MRWGHFQARRGFDKRFLALAAWHARAYHESAMIIPKLRTPIVLVHGLFGFDKIDAFGATIANYFPGIPEFMIAAGNRVFVPFLSPTGSVEKRAKQLRDYILKHAP